MFDKIKSITTVISAWLMKPVVKVKAEKQRLISLALRSRFFLLVAVVTAAPILAEAVGATFAVIRPTGKVTPWLLWPIAILSWVLFILTAVGEHGRLKKQDQKLSA